MNRIQQQFIASMILFVLSLLPAASMAEESRNDTTLSPYFYVEGGASGVESFPLKETNVEATISGVIANVTVRQSYKNNGNAPINARYIFPGSTRAAVHGMAMTVGERRIIAKIRKKETARKIYETAKKEGKTASLLAQQRPNVFSMNVANIMPGDEVRIEMHYTELLLPEDNVYSFVYPTVVGPRYSGQKAADVPREEHWVQNPYLHQGETAPSGFSMSVHLAAGIPLSDVHCASHTVLTDFTNTNEATVTLDPKSGFGGDRDFILDYRLQDARIQTGLLRYRDDNGENYFLLMVQPPNRIAPEEIPPREYLFVLDVSGSMNGFPLDTAKVLIKDLLKGIRQTDTFNVLLFAGSSELLSPHSLPASSEGINQAINFVNAHNGGGGTELLSAMQKALALPRNEGTSRSIVVITDGYISEEAEVFAEIQNNLNTANVFAFGIGSSVNRYLIEGVAKAGQGEPFIVTNQLEAPKMGKRFRDYISTPLLTNIKVETDGAEIYDLEPSKIPDLFAQRPLLLYGKTKDNKGAIRISGTTGNATFFGNYPLAEATPVDDPGLKYLWARSRIARLSDYNPQKKNPDQKAAITNLGLTYNLLTAYTSFVAVDEVVRNPDGKATNVKQPLPLPKGVSNMAVGGGSRSVPEPALFLLLPLLYLVLRLSEKERKGNRK